MRLRELRKLVEDLVTGGGGGISLGMSQLRPNANSALLGGDPTNVETPITPLVPNRLTFVVAHFAVQADETGPAEATVSFKLDATQDPEDPGGSNIDVDEANVLAPPSSVIPVTLCGFVPAGVDYWLFAASFNSVNGSVALNQLYETPL